MDERQVHCTVIYEKRDFLLLSFHETYERQFVPPELFINYVPADMAYEITGEVLVMTFGRKWDLFLEDGETVTAILERLSISLNEKTIRITFEESRTVVRISFPIRGSAPFKWGGLRWQFHKNDLDPWPSTPHGHCKEKAWVIDPYTGEVYDTRTRNMVDSIGKKGLLALHKCLRDSKDFSHYFCKEVNTPQQA